MVPDAGVLVLGCGHVNHIVFMQYFCQNILYSWAYVIQTEYSVMLKKGGSTKIKNVKTHEARERPYKPQGITEFFLSKSSSLSTIMHTCR